MATNWWDSQGEQAYQDAFASPATFGNMYAPQTKSYYDRMKPSDDSMSQYRKATGSNYVDKVDFENWKSISDRFNTLGQQVNSFASSDPTASSNQSRFQSDLSNYGGRLNSYLDAAAPVASQSNRFESGLTDAESRLKSLLDDPNSIKNSAAYQFRVKQGEDALQRQLGAKGLLNSGNRLMELTKYGQDMATQEYDAQSGRLQNLLGNYSQAWTGDKNANTQRYLAESQAWNQRGGLLSDIYKNSTIAANQNQQIGNESRVKWADTLKSLLGPAPTTRGNTTFFNLAK